MHADTYFAHARSKHALHASSYIVDHEVSCSNISVTQSVCTAKLYLSIVRVHNLFVSTAAVNEAGDTPLSLECSRGDLEMVKALMNKDVDPNSKCLSVTVFLLMVVFHRAC